MTILAKGLERVGLTRDSTIWLWTQIVSLSILLSTGVVDIKMLELPEQWNHRILVACGVIAFLAGKLSMSPLKLSPAAQEALKTKEGTS